jgi:hypothetical protein
MAFTVTQKVLTLDYWKLAGTIEKGDYVFTRQGQLARVELVQLYRPDFCYEVTFNDNLSVCGDSKLGLPTESKKYRDRTYQYVGKYKFKRPLQNFRVSDAVDLPLKDYRGRLIYSVPTAEPLQLPHQYLPVPPWIFGFWYMNRRKNGSLLAPDGVDLQIFPEHGYQIVPGRKMPNGRREFRTKPDIADQFFPDVISRIPNNYLLGSHEQRMELLSGIVQGKPNQYSAARDQFRITEMHYGTVLQIQGLVESLGNKSRIHHNEQLKNYTLIFRTRHKLIENQASPPIQVHNARRYITKIRKIPSEMCIHIETDSKDSTILIGEGYIPCH